MGQRKGVDDDNSLDFEIEYQEKMLFLGNFHLEISRIAKQPKNKEMSDKAIIYLTEIALYINKLEHENMEMRLETRFKRSATYNKVIKLLEECLKS